MHSLVRLFIFTNLFVAALGHTTVGARDPSPEDPVVHLVNKAAHQQIWVVQVSMGVPATAWRGNLITVHPKETTVFYPGVGFNGAVTGAHGHGTRYEINFSTPGQTWYDADMEMGMCDSTLGPTNGELTIDRRSSLCGEANDVEKANAAWHSVKSETQQALLNTGYINGTVGGSVTGVRMDKSAPLVVIEFLQQTASFKAYITHGSTQGSDATKSDVTADLQTRQVSTNKMTLTSYS